MVVGQERHGLAAILEKWNELERSKRSGTEQKEWQNRIEGMEEGILIIQGKSKVPGRPNIFFISKDIFLQFLRNVQN